MIALTKSKNVLTATLSIVVCICLIYGGGLWYIRTRTDALAELRREVLHAEEQGAVSRDVRSLIEDTTDKRDRLDQYFIAKDGVADFISMIEALARASGATPLVTNVKVGEGTPRIAPLSLGVTVSGSRQQAAYFLAVIETLPQLVKIDRALIHTVKEAQGGSHWELTLSLTAYKLK